MGGFPIIYLHNYFTRAESDLLTSFIDLYGFCLIHFPEIGDILNNWFWQVPVDPLTCISGLCIDPYSLPLKKPPTYLRNQVSIMIKRRTKNEMIKDLMDLEQEGVTELILDCLKIK